VQISLGHYHGCAILENTGGTRVAKCWGDNRWGQLGRGNTFDVGDQANEMGDSLPAVNFGTGRSPRFLMATGGHTCAILDDQSTKCWGLNTWGQVGLVAGNNAAPTENETQRRTCNGGTGTVRPLDCIGDQSGEMGDVLQAAVAAGESAKLSIGYRHNCVLRTGNSGLVCWGTNEEAQLGRGNGGVTGLSLSIIGDEAGEMSTPTATLVKGRPIEELSAGGFHTCVMYSDLSINCWGQNNFGQLGRSDLALVGNNPSHMGESLVDVNLGT
jgi:alpha-tubulin suppressor-like RCC1 family protein